MASSTEGEQPSFKREEGALVPFEAVPARIQPCGSLPSGLEGGLTIVPVTGGDRSFISLEKYYKEREELLERVHSAEMKAEKARLRLELQEARLRLEAQEARLRLELQEARLRLELQEARLEAREARLEAREVRLEEREARFNLEYTRRMNAETTSLPADFGKPLPLLDPTLTRSDLPITDVTLRQMLGSGWTAEGFLCDVEVAEPTRGGGVSGGSGIQRPPMVEAVAKIFTRIDGPALAGIEASILRELPSVPRHAAMPDWVLPPPKLLAEARDTRGRSVLIITPRGTQCYVMPLAGLEPPPGYAPATAAEFCALVWALLDAHTRGWVHRDPRPLNFFRTEDGSFLLADYGSATRSGHSYRAGEGRGQSIRYGPLKFLSDPGSAPYTPADDFEMVARMVFCAGRQVDPPATADTVALAGFWKTWETCADLQALLAAAAAAGAAVQRDSRLVHWTTVPALRHFIWVIQAQYPLPTPAARFALEQKQTGALSRAEQLV